MSKLKKSKFILTSDLVDLDNSQKENQFFDDQKNTSKKKEISIEKKQEEKKDQLNIRITSGLKKKFQVWCINNNKQMAEVIEEVIKKIIEK